LYYVHISTIIRVWKKQQHKLNEVKKMKKLTQKQQQLLKAVKNNNTILCPIFKGDKLNSTSKFEDYSEYESYQWRTVVELVKIGLIRTADNEDFKMPLGNMFGEPCTSLKVNPHYKG